VLFQAELSRCDRMIKIFFNGVSVIENRLPEPRLILPFSELKVIIGAQSGHRDCR
jgi:hypothetical protein